MSINKKDGETWLKQIDDIVAKNQKSRTQALNSNYFDEEKDKPIDESSLKSIKAETNKMGIRKLK